MLKAHSMSRLGLRAAAGLGAAVASLAFAGIASAAVQTIAPDQALGGSCPIPANSSSTLTTAIQNATASSNTIVLTPGIYCPILPAGQSTITIAHNLNIVADHSFQGTGGLPNFQIQGLDVNGANNFTVSSGVTLTLEGINVDLGGYNNGLGGGDTIVNDGTLLSWGTTFDGDFTPAINNATASSVATLDDSTVSDASGDGIVNSGTLTLQDSSLLNNSGHAIDINNGSHTNAYDTLVAGTQQSQECFGGSFSNAPAPGSLDDTTSCGAQYSGNTDVDNYLAGNAQTFYTGNEYTNGGPDSTTALPPNPDTTLKGNSTYCFTTDARFFVNPVSGGKIECDIGAVTGALDNNLNPYPNSATQETAGATCKVTGTTTPTQQTVTLNDLASGIGPEIGLETDNPSNSVATAYPPPLAVPVAGYDVDNLQISNGSVSFTSPTAPTTSGVVLTAGNKTTPGTNNSQWSFTGLNWAGVATNCF